MLAGKTNSMAASCNHTATYTHRCYCARILRRSWLRRPRCRFYDCSPGDEKQAAFRFACKVVTTFLPA